MRITTGAKTIIVGVVAATAVAGAGIGYAAASTSASTTLKACANAKAQLAVQSSKGTCPKGFKAVSLNRQGPKGATGAKGPKGATGPGARSLHLSSSGSGQTPTVLVGKFGYYLGCDIATSGGHTTVVAEVGVVAPSGQTASLNTLYSYTTGDTTTLTATKAYRTSFTNQTTFHSSGTDNVVRTYVDAMRIVAADGTVQLLSADVSADGRATPSGNRCQISGLVIPSA